jgi:hypothetical protein
LDFFDRRQIKWWMAPRSGDDVEAPGPTQNMVSSQVACVNFLLPLAEMPAALTAMLRSIDSDVVDVAPIEYDLPDGGRAASRVEFEWVGMKGSLEGAAATRGMNVTSVDALMIARTEQGNRRAYLVEWKNAEGYPPDDCKGLGKSGQTRRARYSALYDAPDSPFNGSAPIDDLLYEPFYQLMRLGLLGAKMVRERELGITEARIVVVCPAANGEYRNRVTSPALRARPVTSVVQVMQAVARTPEMFRVVDPAPLATAIAAVAEPSVAEWVRYNSDRYGWLSG